MTALIIIGAVILVIIGILSLRATLTLKYRDDIEVILKILFIKIKIAPAKKKRVNPNDYTPEKFRRMMKKKRKKELKKWQKKQRKKLKKQQKKEREQAEAAESVQTKKKRSLTDNLLLIKSLLDTLPRRFLNHLRVKLTRIIVTVASDDAAKTAVMYGLASQTVAYIVAFLDHMTKLRYAPDAEVSVNADFLAEKPSADVEISFSLHVWHLFDLLFAAAVTLIKNK